MEFESVRNFVATIGLLIVVFGPAVSFRSFVRRQKYRMLLEDISINLNVGSLVAAYFRKDSDPLKPLHRELAVIGFVHYMVIVIGIIVVIFSAAAFTVYFDN